MKIQKFKMPVKILISVLCVMLAALVFVLCYLAYLPKHILPDNFRYGLYIVDTDTMEPSLHRGSLAFADKNTAEGIGSAVVYNREGAPIFSRIAKVEGDGVFVLADSKTEMTRLENRGIYPISYQINGGGSFILWLNQYRIAVWACCFVVAATTVLLFATLKNRRRKKARKNLQSLFEFYGKKYELEDAGETF